MTVMLLYGTNREKGNSMLAKMKDYTGSVVVWSVNVVTTVIAKLFAAAIFALVFMFSWNLMVPANFPGLYEITWMQSFVALVVMYGVYESITGIATTTLTILEKD